MTRNILSILMSASVIITAQCLPTITHATSASSKPPKLEYMDYSSARKIILSYGWSPMPGPCKQVSNTTCSRFPEIESCSGVGLGYCGMLFVKQNRCLYLLTTGGPPESDTEDYAQVEQVTFRHGPCSKS